MSIWCLLGPEALSDMPCFTGKMCTLWHALFTGGCVFLFHQVYQVVGKPLVEASMTGLNSILMAYGQTGAGLFLSFLFNAPFISVFTYSACSSGSVGTYYVTTFFQLVIRTSGLSSPCTAFECNVAYFTSPHPPPGRDETHPLSSCFRELPLPSRL